MQETKQILSNAIAQAGSISFSGFMQIALYSEAGFFRSDPVGRDFATSIGVSPVFASCIAVAVSKAQGSLGASTSMVEGGAGDGTLAARLARSAPKVAAGIDYVAIEQDPAAAAHIEKAAAGFKSATVCASTAELKDFEGMFFANELFDNVPFDRLARRDGQLVEIRVTERGGVLEFCERPAAEDLIAQAARLPDEGEEVTCSPRSVALLQEVLAKFERGYVLVIDYGAAVGEPFEAVRGYREHQLVENVLEQPGTCDITGPVAFDPLVAACRAAGLESAIASEDGGITTQRQLLHALGYRAFVDGLARKQSEAEEAGDNRKAVTYWNARGEASMLVAENQLGHFRVLVMKSPDLPDLIELSQA